MAPFLTIILLAFMCTASFAQGSLSAQDISRVKELKSQLKDVDHKTLDETIAELENSKYPHLNVELKEAMARTYTDIVQAQQISSKQTKEYLYSMIALNLAYLQFGGPQQGAKDKDLNVFIRQKLQHYLTPEITHHPGFKHSIG